MSKVTYLLGAGASAGQKGSKSERISGVPTICEFAKEVELCRQWIKGRIDEEESKKIELCLLRLHSICKQYPTVDTYAKQLSVIGLRNEYEELKTAISLFLTIIQLKYPHDIRYDGWIASVIDKDGFFPDNINVLSWNYDAQFEMAISGYFSKYTLRQLWGILNVSNKTYLSMPKDNGFFMAKLNGTAFFHWDDTMGLSDIYDPLVHPDKDHPVEVILSQILSHTSNVHNELSYVWDFEAHHNRFRDILLNKVKDTDIVVTIGYSFPYVNREMDKFIFSNMPNLRKIYVQDTNSANVIERIKGRLGNRDNIGCIPITDTDQFYIPNELD